MEAVQVNISDEKSPGGIPAVADSGTLQDKRSAAGLPVAFLTTVTCAIFNCVYQLVTSVIADSSSEALPGESV